MFIALTIGGVALGVFVSSPLLFALLLFGGLFAVTPAVLAAGAWYGDDLQRACCIGGTAAGVVPLGMASVYFLYFGHRVVGPGWNQLLRTEGGEILFDAALALLLPLPPIIAGGYIALRMRRAYPPVESPER